MLPFWCPLQWETETSVGSWTASKSLRIWSPYLIGGPQVVKWPLSFQMEACTWHQKDILGVSVNGYSFPFLSSKVQVRAMSSANWAEVPGGKGLDSMVPKLETTAYLGLLFPSKAKQFPSVYQISSGLVRGSSENPSQGFVQWSNISRQEWKGREPLGVGRRVAGLRSSQRDTVMPGFSTSTTWYLRILWSDITGLQKFSFHSSP